MRIPSLLSILLVALSLHSCSSMAGGSVKVLSVDDYQKQLASTPTAQLLDVRTPEEYAEKHLKDAVNINFNADDFIDKIDHLDRSKPIFVYCLSGGRSEKAAALISKKGFHDVYNMEGGILAWSNAKKPLEMAAGAEAKGLTMPDYLAKIKNDKLVLVDFNAVWCGPCKLLKPILDKVADTKKNKVLITPIDVDQNPAIAEAMHINSIPLMILYKNGKEVWRQLGLVSQADIEKVVDQN